MNINEIKDFVEGKLIMCGYEIRNGDLDIEEMDGSKRDIEKG